MDWGERCDSCLEEERIKEKGVTFDKERGFIKLLNPVEK